MFSRIKTLLCCGKKSKNSYDIKRISYSNSKNYLQDITYKDTIPFIPPIVYCKVIKVYDGDTITVAAKLPFRGSPLYRFSVRLASIDSPEIKGSTAKECVSALKSRDALDNLIFGKIIELRNNGKEKYGRLLADVYLNVDNANDLHVNQWMLDNKLAIKYDGGKKQPFCKSTF
jgi:endonuclease YncB( thermonuclease family)